MKCPKCHSENPDHSKFCGDCGSKLFPFSEAIFSKTMTVETPIKVLSTGKIFADKYAIVGEIGRGGMGIVYKAEDIRLKRMVALKFLPAELSAYPEAKERFVREARAAAALSHPNICTIHEVEEVEGQSYIAMEYVEGQNLRQKIVKGPMDSDTVMDIAIQVAAGLETAHRKGIIHRDIKSANIMVTEKGQAKIMDFGLAKVAGESQLTKEARTIGTIAYMSPEQAQGEDLDNRTDIWSFGVMLYEMLTGQLPFRGERESIVLHSIVGAEPKPLRQINSHIPVELQKMIDRALKKKREDRYHSAGEMLEDLQAYLKQKTAEEAGVYNLRTLWKRLRRPQVAVPTAASLILLVVLSVWFVSRGAKIHWAKQTAIPEIMRLIGQEKYADAFKMARQAELLIPKDPLLAGLWPKMSQEVNFETNPAGASILYKDYHDPSDSWKELGKTPIRGSRVPWVFFRWRIEKPGYAPVERAAWPPEDREKLSLDPADSLPPGMIRVPGGEHVMRIPTLTTFAPVEFDDVLMDKYEVTNRQFKEFVDKGGYQKREFWKIPFKKDGRVIPWENAMGQFRDKTGRPGPSTWEIGTCPDGQEDYPVSGISWYEAAAYAEFTGKTLPTVYHWTYAAGFDNSSFIITESNFAGKGSSSVGSYRGMSPFGTFDMAGNVKEWCWNDDGFGRHYLLGGAWEDQEYLFFHLVAGSPFDRSATNGFRCVKPIAPAKIPEKQLSSLVFPPPRDFSNEKPVSDEMFNAFKRIFSYDKTDLRAKIESTDSSAPQWTKEKISFNAAYGNERMAAFLFLPKNGKPPYQTVIYFPGGHVVNLRSSENIQPLAYILISGRAFLYPVYKSMFERGDGFTYTPPHLTVNSARDHDIYWYKDFARSIDYLETRPDIDPNRLAFTGVSLGAELGNIFLALEKRIKASILFQGGFLPFSELRDAPEVDYLNFAPRVVCPTLMLNGRYDYLMPLESAQKPMFNLLGTPPENKRHILYDTGHFVPSNELIKETLNWLDRYLGPVK